MFKHASRYMLLYVVPVLVLSTPLGQYIRQNIRQAHTYVPFFKWEYIRVHIKLTTSDLIPFPSLPIYVIPQRNELVELVGRIMVMFVEHFEL